MAVPSMIARADPTVRVRGAAGIVSGNAAMKPIGSPHARVSVRVSWHQIIEALADAIESGRDQSPCPFSERDAEICEYAAKIIREMVAGPNRKLAVSSGTYVPLNQQGRADHDVSGPAS